MSNSLIPYSFIPGAKAKAQEVNANFISLAEKIEENLEYTNTQIEETVEKINQSSSSMEDKKADKNLGNTNLITNCVLEAPNGVAEASENVITLKQGLKVLIPSGFNEDGTVKNIVHELSEDVDVTTVKTSALACIYITQDGCNYSNNYFVGENEPYTKAGLWYHYNENQAYLYNTDSQSWETINAVVVATYENSNDIVSLVEVSTPIRVLTASDRKSVVSWGIPLYSLASGRSIYYSYTATRAGYVYLFGVSQGNQYEYIHINGKSFSVNWVNSGSQAGNTTMFPVRRGDTYYTDGNFYKSAIYFIPIEGDI